MSGLGGGLYGGTGPLGSSVTESELSLSDITTANATAARHGLLPKLSNSASDVLKGDGTWGTVSAGLGGSTGATDNAVLRADGTGGSTIQSSPVTISDTGSITVPSGQAVTFTTAGQLRIIGASGLKITDTDLGFSITQDSMTNLSTDRTVTWPDIDGTVVVGSAVGTTVGAAGAASALPAAPLGYLTVTLPDGSEVKIAYYNT